MLTCSPLPGGHEVLIYSSHWGFFQGNACNSLYKVYAGYLKGKHTNPNAAVMVFYPLKHIIFFLSGCLISIFEGGNLK